MSRWERYALHYEKEAPLKHAGERWTLDEFLLVIEKYDAKDKVALEIGCGTGRIIERLASSFKYIYGIDCSEVMIRRAKELVNLPNVSFQLNDGFTLEDFKDESIGVVFSHEVFHLLEPIVVYVYLMEIKRVLRPGGMGIISFYDFVSRYESFLKESLKTLKNKQLPPIYTRYMTNEILDIMFDSLQMEILEKVSTGRFFKVVFVRGEE